MYPLVSVIVPVYNVERYIGECMDSIIGQTYRNLEIIVVDDGSTDGSGQICDGYAKLDTRITVYHKQNGGLSDARNYGLNRCHGLYIYFIDSDDVAASDAIKYLYDLILKYDADVSSCRTFPFATQVPNQGVNTSVYGSYTATPKETIEKMCFGVDISHAAPDKLFHRSLWENIRFPHVIYEDYAIIYYVIAHARKCAIGLDYMSYYRQRSTSIMQREFDQRELVLLDIADGVSDWLLQKYPDIDYGIIHRKVWTYFEVLKDMMDSGTIDKGVEKRIMSCVRENKDILLTSDKIQTTTKLKMRLLCLNKWLFYYAYDILEQRRKRKII